MRIRLALAAGLTITGIASADYYSNPEIRPEYRCKDIPAGIGSPADPGGPASLHCQRLFWDLPPTTRLGAPVVAAQFAEDPIPRFPNGITDRIPPIWIGTLKAVSSPLALPAGKSVGQTEGFESEADCRAYANGCQRLCSDPFDVPYWKEIDDAEGRPVIGTDGSPRTGVDPATGASTGQPQRGPLYQVECRRGSRSYYGPWQTGGTVDLNACLAEPDHSTNAVAGACQGPVFDRLADTQPIRFENTARLDDDQLKAGTPPDRRLEWNLATEYYNHFASHHGTCYQPVDVCTDVNRPLPASAYSDTDPSATCYKYEKVSEPGSPCYAGDADPRCQPMNFPDGTSYKVPMGGFRNATQLPGRLSVPLPDNRGVLAGEDIVWGCNHHVVTQLPPGSYGMSRLANYRLQTHGIKNPTSDTIYGTPPGQEFGGAVGEMIIQYFTAPLKAAVKPVNANFNAAADLATTFYPPFTWNYHQSQWEPPFDSEVAIMAIHSHHRMVKGTMDVLPVNPPRPNDTDPVCGGPQPDGTPATNLYTDWFWEDAPVCQFWKQKDGPVPLRKGESLQTTCMVNNGITPEAIKHGLVSAGTVRTLREMGAPIPDYPALVPASTWGDPLQKSAVGQDLLYGMHPPINYRVVYKCSTNSTLKQIPGGSNVVLPEGIGDLYQICTPNPAVDSQGDYVDGAYKNDLQCGGGLCEPSSIVFACVGEDEMCIGVALYWKMEGPINPDGSVNPNWVQSVQSGNLNQAGTPGSTNTPSDYPSGNCAECGPPLIDRRIPGGRPGL